MKLLVTGSSGFIGYHTAKALLGRGHSVVGADSMNAYYDPKLKHARLRILRKIPGFRFAKIDLADRRKCADLFSKSKVEGPRSKVQSPMTGAEGEQGGAKSSWENEEGHDQVNQTPPKADQANQDRKAPPFDAVVHLAAQAGVRYSLTDPHAYVDSNLTAFVNVLEGCRHSGVPHLVYASSSSVYGGNTKLPFSETDRVDGPISLYAATKKADELMAHAYSHLFGMRCTGLRFFTVYGPFGRPDMAMYKFTKAIIEGSEIEVYNHGEMWRDFTYVDDIVEGVVKVAESPKSKVEGPKSKVEGPKPEGHASMPGLEQDCTSDLGPGASDPGPPAESGESAGCEAASGESGAHAVYNIGNNRPEYLMDLVAMLEEELGRKALIRFLPMQPGDVPKTYADISALDRDFGFRPSTPLREGVRRFVEWYLGYHKKRGGVRSEK